MQQGDRHHIVHMPFKNRNLFRITRFLLLKLPGLYKFLAKFRTARPRLLIIKTDAIGDYILFRNFIEIINSSASFKGYGIDVLGNELWQDIAPKYDSRFITNFIFINPDDLYYSPIRALRLSIKLFRGNYQTVLQPAFSRTFINDGLAGFTAAKNIIGFEGDTERMNAIHKLKTDIFYTQRVTLPENITFEFDRSRFFIEQVLGHNVNIDGPFLNIDKGNRDGIIIFPGAGVSKRRWEAEKFVALIRLILRESKHQIYLAGDIREVETGNYLMANLPVGRVNNLTGKTSLNQLIELIGNATLVVSNETSAIHISAAVKTPVVCILGGGHFGRFAPYPFLIEASPACVYEKMECFNCNWQCIYNMPEDASFPCIAAVTLEKVWANVQLYL